VKTRVGSPIVANVIDPLLRTIGVRPGARILHLQRSGDLSRDSVICDRLWWTSAGDDAAQGRATLIERREAPASNLPFADAQFDFAVCTGVVERLVTPAPFCAELMRTARAGYLECRRAVAQILHPDATIRWLVDHECDTLFLREADPGRWSVLDGLRRRIDGKRSLEESMRDVCGSASLRPLMYAEVVWTGRLKYRIVRATEH
jgi:hypothetical protein